MWTNKIYPCRLDFVPESVINTIGRFQKISIPYRGRHLGIPRARGVLWPGIPKARGVFRPGIPKAWGVSVLDFQRAKSRRVSLKNTNWWSSRSRKQFPFVTKCCNPYYKMHMLLQNAATLVTKCQKCVVITECCRTYGFITNSQCDQLPVGLIAQLVEHCTSPRGLL